MENNEKKISSRQAKQKPLLLEQLKKTPIRKVACERSGVARATLYRWQNEDDGFRKAVDLAILEGRLLINDMSEFQLLSLIQDRNPATIKYWLEKHHPDYMRKSHDEKSTNYKPPVTVIFDE